MARAYLAKFENAGLSLTRLHTTGFLKLLRFFYDERLKRVGNNTPEEPLFPQAGQGVSVLFQHVEPGEPATMPLVLKSTSYQHKNETSCLLLYMMYGTDDETYEGVLDRYCEGMRVPVVAAKARLPQNKGMQKGGGAGTQGGASGGIGAGGNGARATMGGVRRPLYYPSPPPPLPAISSSLHMNGQLAGTGDVHPEFLAHHGHQLPPLHVAVFLLTCTEEGSTRRYTFDEHRLFCINFGDPQVSTLTQCLRQRVVWPVADIGYVVLRLPRAFYFPAFIHVFVIMSLTRFLCSIPLLCMDVNGHACVACEQPESLLVERPAQTE